MSDENGVPRRDMFMKAAIFCSRTASPQTQYYPHAAWCYQTRQPFHDQTLSQNIQTTQPQSALLTRKNPGTVRIKVDRHRAQRHSVPDCGANLRLRGSGLIAPQCLGLRMCSGLKYRSQLEFSLQFSCQSVHLCCDRHSQKVCWSHFSNDMISRSHLRLNFWRKKQEEHVFSIYYIENFSSFFYLK